MKTRNPIVRRPSGMSKVLWRELARFFAASRYEFDEAPLFWRNSK